MTLDAGVRGRIEAVLEQLRPGLQADGGDLVLLDFADDGLLRVRLTGCHSCCPMATVTLQAALENALSGRVPEVTRVVCTR